MATSSAMTPCQKPSCRAAWRQVSAEADRGRAGHHHQFLNREGRWGTTDDFATSFLHFSLFSTALWDLPNSRPVNSLMTSSYLFLSLPCLLPFSLCLARWFWPDLMNGKHDHTTAVCDILRSSGLCVVHLPAGSWHGLPRW